MTVQYKVAFNELEWESPIEGVRHKCTEQDGLRLRLVEYSRQMPDHWCEEGHYGYIIEGRMEIEYENARVVYGPRDGVFIPDGPDHRHRGRALSDRVLVFFVEETNAGLFAS